MVSALSGHGVNLRLRMPGFRILRDIESSWTQRNLTSWFDHSVDSIDICDRLESERLAHDRSNSIMGRLYFIYRPLLFPA